MGNSTSGSARDAFGERLSSVRQRLRSAPRDAEDPSSGVSPRDLDIGDLPPDVGEALQFDQAGARSVDRLRDLPPEAREAFRLIWDDLVADVYDELKGTSRSKMLRPSTVSRVLGRITGQVEEASKLLIVTATHAPMASHDEWRHIGAAAVASGVSAGVNEVITVSSLGAGTAAALTTAVSSELLETYLAASARVLQYRKVGRNPTPARIAGDLALALGEGGRFATHANRESSEMAVRWMNRKLVNRVSRRFMRGLVPVAGMAWAASASARDMRKVLHLPLSPPEWDELERQDALAAGRQDPFVTAQDDFRAFLDQRRP